MEHTADVEAVRLFFVPTRWNSKFVDWITLEIRVSDSFWKNILETI